MFCHSSSEKRKLSDVIQVKREQVFGEKGTSLGEKGTGWQQRTTKSAEECFFFFLLFSSSPSCSVLSVLSVLFVTKSKAMVLTEDSSIAPNPSFQFVGHKVSKVRWIPHQILGSTLPTGHFISAGYDGENSVSPSFPVLSGHFVKEN